MAEAFHPLVLVVPMAASLVQGRNGSRVVRQLSEVHMVTLHAARALEEVAQNRQVAVEHKC